MSRSALQKALLKQPIQPPLPPTALPAQQYFMCNPQAYVPISEISQAYVPIRLTGDEEDDDGPGSTTNILPIYGNSSNYNINSLLFNNIMENDYFRALYQLRTYHEVIDEIYRSVDHIEPWQTGTARFPSTAFCLLVKFMLMKLTLKQMKGLLSVTDCPYMRGIGLLYLRYTCPPTDLWKWYEPYLEDEEEFAPTSDKGMKMTVGDLCIKLLTDMQYYGTTLPRIPVPIERKMKVMLLLLSEKKNRRRNNMRDKDKGKFSAGTKVRAIYSDADNEPAWYEAVIDSQDNDSDNKYWVTFPEYGNTECVDLGDMELLPVAGSCDVNNSDGEVDSHNDDYNRRGGGGGGADKDKRTVNKRSRSRSRDNSNSRQYSRQRNNSDSEQRDNEYHKRRHRNNNDDEDGNKDHRRSGGRNGYDNSYNRDRRYNDDDYNNDENSNNDSRSGGIPRNSSTSSISASGGGATSDSLLQKVLQREREASAAIGRNYGQRPVSYKGSLSLKADRYTARRKSPSPDRHHHHRSNNNSSSGNRRRSRSRSHNNNGGGSRSTAASSNHNSSSSSSGRETTAMIDNSEQLQRMKLLKARYGDASAAETNKR